MHLFLKAFIFLIALQLTSCTTTRYKAQEMDHSIAHQEIPLQKKRILVAIDAGHGGKDIGAQAAPEDFQEKKLTLICARHVKKMLEESGLNVLMIRSSDATIPVSARAPFANANNASLFISIHFNSAQSTDAQGIEIFFYEKDENQERMESSKKLASAILDSTLAYTEAKSRGVKKGNFAVIRETTMPAVLVEAGFVTNAEEMNRLRNPIYLQKISRGMSNGIINYLKDKKKCPRRDSNARPAA
jgi:N-acetylmuramoyl-L-alanine amidase